MLVNGQIQPPDQLYAPFLEAEIAEWGKVQSVQPTKDYHTNRSLSQSFQSGDITKAKQTSV